MRGSTVAATRRRARRMRAPGASLARTAWTLVLAALVVFCLAAPALTARATVPGVDSVTLNWDTNNRVYYGQYNTPIFSTTDGQGRVTFAYCVDPTVRPPDAADYATVAVGDFNPGWEEQVRAAMWFGYGGPGFDASMWPTAWSDGGEMTSSYYYCETHLILSYLTTHDLGMTYYSAGTEFIDYSARTYLGIDLQGNVVNPDSTMYQMLARADEVPDDFVCYYLDCGKWDYTQYIIGQDYYGEPVQTGSLSVEKVSSNPVVSDGNPCYSLEGARFGVYADEACTQLVCEIATDANGRGRADGLAAGTYWVKETAAPAGYALDAAVHEVTVPAGDAVALRLSDVPQTAVPSLLVQKVDAQAGAQAQGTASLAGAEFAVRFYAGSYTLDNLPEKPTRAWVFSSDEQGRVLLDAGYLVSGDELYLNDAGTPALPLGTVVVQETKAPADYQLSDTSLHLVALTSGGTSQTVDTYVAPTIADEPACGGVSVQKADLETGDATPQGSASMAGAEFSIVTLNATPVVVDGMSYAQGERVATIVTDASGYAATAADALPCGVYRVQETKAPAGYLLSDASWDVEVRAGAVVCVGDPVTSDGASAASADQAANRTQEAPFAALANLFGPSTAHADEVPGESPVVPEQVVRGGLSVRKVDADTGGAAQGNASLAGARFAVVNANDNPVVVGGKSYAPGETVMVITTDENGYAQTGEQDLPYGTYTVSETAAPQGYLTDTAPQTVEVRENGVVAAAPEPFRDQVVRGGIALVKVDADTGGAAQGTASLAGARFAIANASEAAVVVDGTSYEPGAVVATLTTDENGHAQTGAQDLPFGTYTVTEVAPPAGYALDETAQTVTVSESGVLVQMDSPYADRVLRGGVSVQKADAEIGSAGPQGGAVYEGAVFEIVNANANAVVVGGASYQPDETVARIVTDERGYAQTGAQDLPLGTYLVREAQAPAGYLPNETVWQVEVTQEGAVAAAGTPFGDEAVATPEGDDDSEEENDDEEEAEETGGGFNPFEAVASLFSPGQALADETEEPAEESQAEARVPEQVVRGGVAVQKVDAETGLAEPQGGASLAGTQFAVASLNDNPVVVNGRSYEKGEVVLTVVSDETGLASSGAYDLPYGTYSIVETSPPDGYLPAEEAVSQTFTVSENGQVVTLGTPFENRPVRGGLAVQKVDAETGLAEPLADASLVGTVFAVANANDHAVTVGGTSYGPGEVVLTLVTDKDGRAQTGEHDLPYGTYTVAEVEPPEGYTPGGGTAQTVRIEQEGVVVACTSSFSNRVVRGDVSGVKIEDGTGEVLAGVAFLVTSLTTGESHVLVADEEGRFSTESSHAAHSDNTNANDAALGPDGTVADESVLSSGNGVWFSGADGAEGSPDDEVGALPFDVYRFEELVTSASYGHDPVSFEVALRTDRTVVDLGLIGNSVISLHTTARLAATGTDEGSAQEGMEIVDTVAYEGLAPGTEYELRAELMDRDTGEPITAAGEPVQATVAFTPGHDGSGEVEVAFEIDASELAGVRVVVFERLYLDGQEVAAHADIADDGQTVTFVEIGTTALGATSSTHEEQVSAETTVVDAVSYTGLTPGRVYEVTGVLMDRASGEPLLDAAGNEVTASASFEPAAPSGSVDLAFTFDGTSLAGTTAVAFETLSRDGVEVAVHADIDDDAQAVTLVDIGTAAVDKASGSHTSTSLERAAIVDTVRYEGLTPGEEYVLEGILIVREDGTPLADETGRAVSATVAFVPESPRGEVEVEFSFDATGLQGHSVVVFENLVHDGVIVASHADLDDEGQTVTWPSPFIPRLGSSNTQAIACFLAAAGFVAAAGGLAALLARRRSRNGRRTTR